MTFLCIFGGIAVFTILALMITKSSS